MFWRVGAHKNNFKTTIAVFLQKIEEKKNIHVSKLFVCVF